MTILFASHYCLTDKREFETVVNSNLTLKIYLLAAPSLFCKDVHFYDHEWHYALK